jgi:Zn-dependent protease with chaperone function
METVKKVRSIVITCVLVLLAGISVASAQGDEENLERDPVVEQEIYDRLGQIDPRAVPIFQEATRAMDAGDLTAARQGYEDVLSLAPEFPPAARRLSYVELELGDVESALEHAGQAYIGDPSPYNENALARALLATEDPAHYNSALAHAKTAAEALPEDPSAQNVLLWAGIVNEEVDVVRQASASLTQIAPEYPVGHYFAGVVAAEDGKWEEAERRLLLAQELGMSSEDVQQVLEGGIRSRARTQRWLRRGGYTFAGWLASPLVLLLVGVLLSRLTLTAAYRSQSITQFEVGRGERWIRALYRVVIATTSLYFYVSIPLLILIVVAGTAGLFYLFYVAGRIPVRLALVIGLGALYTLYAIVRSVLTKARDAEPGRLLAREEAPGLWSVVEEVAERLDTRPVDAIYATPAPEIAVMERGGLWRKLHGAGQRCLILGLGALPGMTQGQFKAVLAHEYGHFSNRDTAGGYLARQVRASVNQLAFRLAMNGQARWYNPAWLFVNGFNRLFLRITLGASRLQEILADRYAAVAYGATNFGSGLRHIVRQSLLFDMQVNSEIQTAGTQGRDLQNIYALPVPQTDDQLEQLEASTLQAMDRPTSPYSSHPAPQERIALLEHIDAVGDLEEDQELVWDLLNDPEGLQAEMTKVVQRNVRRQRR